MFLITKYYPYLKSLFDTINNKSAIKRLFPLFGLILLGIFGLGMSKSILANDSVNVNKATFAGGCFWHMVTTFDKVPGVIEVISGYTGGHIQNPTYEKVTAGGSGHAEAIQVLYDPNKISYPQLLEVFWHNVDPTVTDRQFCDVGSEYRAEIFYHNQEQQYYAEQSKAELALSKPFKKPIVIKITNASAFYPAEEYHQYYYRKNPLRFEFYRYTCGRERRLKDLWGKLFD
jgi:peptide-methionine (S)-S-oxide reductase